MKRITAEEAIDFAYDGATKLSIGPEGVVVSDEVAKVVQDRLGGNVSVEDAEPAKEPEDASALSYDDLKARAKELGLKQNGSKDEIAERIADEEKRLADEKAEAGALAADGKKKATQEDLDANPALAEQGVQVGDLISIPAVIDDTK